MNHGEYLHARTRVYVCIFSVIKISSNISNHIK